MQFGTSSHRGDSLRHSFNELHILLITQAIAKSAYRLGVTGPCCVGRDTHTLSELAFISLLEMLSINAVDMIVQDKNGLLLRRQCLSHAIISYNRRGGALADGIIITPFSITDRKMAELSIIRHMVDQLILI